MNRYDFVLEGIARRKISIEAANEDDAFAYLNNMIGRTSIAEFNADEFEEMDVYIEKAFDSNGELIEDENDEIDEEDFCDGIYVCPHCMKKGK